MTEATLDRTEQLTPSALISEITTAWRAVLKHDNFTPDQDFFDVGGNSMLLIAMLETLQDKTGKEIPVSALAEGVSVNRIEQLLK